MRTIKFRGKNRDKNEWVNGDLVVDEDGMHNVVRAKIITHCFTKSFQGGGFDHYSISTLVEPKTIGQFTGLLDKNGMEIYEGDVVHLGDPRITYVLLWLDCGLKAKQIGAYGSFCGVTYWAETMTIVGNIHDNPELLKNND